MVPVLPAAFDEAVTRAVGELGHRPGALLPILHAVQDALGFVPSEAVPRIATALNLSRAEVHGVVTYYHHFRSDPPARHAVQVCRAEACRSMGAEALWAHAGARLGCGSGAIEALADAHARTSADGEYSLEPVFCLGLCASAPAVVIDGRLHARVDPPRFDRLLASRVDAKAFDRAQDDDLAALGPRFAQGTA